MKSLIIILCFILLFVSTNPLAAAAEKVVDKEGNPLQPGVEYYARYFIASAGGPSLASIGNNVCPLSVIQLGWTEPDGIPITIQPKEGGTDIVELSNVFIEFKGSNTSLCLNDSTIWRVNWDSSTTRTVITVGGSYNSCLSEFQIEKTDLYAYRFLFRPIPVLIDRFISLVLVPGGVVRLVLNSSPENTPYLVEFFKKPNLDGIRLPK